MSPAADARFSGGPKTDDAQRVKESPGFSPGLPRRRLLYTLIVLGHDLISM
jgi:hypothetical protein